ncbi:MAG: DUF4422 domain-containing protein [Clostridiales bacterium]|nr:DUF4422 domain-containing protein [Clostridiales bacterium]
MNYKEEKVKVVVACHKKDPNIRSTEMYFPLQVGKKLHADLDLGIPGDNTGENISDKNASYCELTAMYWAWKNLQSEDYLGLAHYRRYFDVDESTIRRELKKGNTLISKEYVSDVSNLVKLASFIGLEDTYILLDTLLDLYPEMKSSVIDYFCNSNKYTVFNMLIAHREVYNEYCRFLFPLLEKVESRVKPSGYTRQKRNIGYMGEALLGLWMSHNKLSVTALSTTSDKKNNPYKLKIRNLIRNLTFKMNNLHRAKKIDLYDSVVVGLKNDGIFLPNLQ